MHQENHCGCGGSHCQGAHEHHHEHGEHCGCHHAEAKVPAEYTPLQADVLLELSKRGCLPVACFALVNAQEDELYSVALEPVYLGTSEDTMEQVKQLGGELSGLADAGLITLDYDIPLKGYAYEEYRTSALYAYFVKTVEEAKGRPGNLFDTPVLELGSMALTEAGEALVAEFTRG